MENVLAQLQSVPTGEVEYLTLRVDGQAVAKGGIDFVKEAGAAAIRRALPPFPNHRPPA